ncbi:diguanylate cyclase [Falsibacillus pallidus]|uniref:diguanylate cyclase n=1 Tax=Falsibacillus pallidus TaxID=493781 RepID=UPI003D98BBD9
MKKNKYQILLFEKINNQLGVWMDEDLMEMVDNDELYRFLHSIKGTAGTIELIGLQHLAETLMTKLEKKKIPQWEKSDLRVFLAELISLTYEFESYEEPVGPSPQKKSAEDEMWVQIIDDDVSMMILLKDILEEQGWMVIANTQAEKAIEQYFAIQPDCLIIDIHLQSKSGFQILEDIQDHNKKRFVPKIMISAKNDRDTRIAAYKMGADDFIEKPVDLEEFIVRVDRQLQRKRMFDEFVLTDELTKISNRKCMEETLSSSLVKFKNGGQMFSVGILDIDHFKNINDQFGHLIGDQVLIDFAQFLKKNIRDSDEVFRFGGEEFVVFLPNTNEEDALRLMNKLLEMYSSKTFDHLGKAFTVTFSGGIFEVSNIKIDLSNILKKADQALYMAKENGRARMLSASALQTAESKRKLFVSIIDDDFIIRSMIKRMLETMQLDQIELDIELFEDGFKFFHSGRPEVNGEHFLVLDGMMPVMDGIEVLQKIHEQNREGLFRVLMLTARKSENDIARALHLGADDYVTKPFSITELQARIKRLIERSS